MTQIGVADMCVFAGMVICLLVTFCVLLLFGIRGASSLSSRGSSPRGAENSNAWPVCGRHGVHGRGDTEAAGISDVVERS